MKNFKDMLCIDADAHVTEPEEAFAPKYFDPAYRDRRPKIVEPEGDLYWMDRLIKDDAELLRAVARLRALFEGRAR